MATRRTKSKTKKAAAKKSVVVGFLGTGKVSAKSVKALLGDFVPALDGDAVFAIPLNEDHYTNSMAEVATYAEDNGIVVLAIHDGDEDNDPDDLLEGEFEATEADDVIGAIIESSDKVVLLWEDSEEMEGILDAVLDADKPAYDLTAGLQEMEFEEPEDADEDDPEDEDDEPADEDDDEPEDDEDAEEVDLATIDISALDQKDDRERIMAIGEALGVESYKGMRVGTMVKEIKKAQKVLQQTGASAPATVDDEVEEVEVKKAPAKKKASKTEEPETKESGEHNVGEAYHGEAYHGEALSTGLPMLLAHPNITVNLTAADLTDEDVLNGLRDLMDVLSIN